VSDLLRGCWSLRPSQTTATHSARRLPRRRQAACVPSSRGSRSVLLSAGVDVAADDQQRRQPKNSVMEGDAAQAATPRINIDGALGRRVTHEETTLRAIRQQFRCLLLGEVVAPGAEGRDRNAAAQTKERQRGDG
jgi:hypothetical protein